MSRTSRCPLLGAATRILEEKKGKARRSPSEKDQELENPYKQSSTQRSTKLGEDKVDVVLHESKEGRSRSGEKTLPRFGTCDRR